MDKELYKCYLSVFLRKGTKEKLLIPVVISCPCFQHIFYENKEKLNLVFVHARKVKNYN